MSNRALAAQYRKRADGCRRKANLFADKSDRARWPKFADEWRKLAEDAEQGPPLRGGTP
jgi:hypothetical protein